MIAPQRLLAVTFALGLSTAALGSARVAPPDWVFPRPTPSAVQGPTRPDPTLRHIPQSPLGFTDARIDDMFAVPDWRPGEHPAMPAVVARGRAPGVFACGHCHMPAGEGRPENASLASLSAGYIVQQVEEMRAGRRRSSVPTLLPARLMNQVAVHVRPDEAAQAAAYYSRLAYRSRVRVVESATAPRLSVTGASSFEPVAGPREPIGLRVVEVPDSPERFERRDPAASFTAYVPPGSIKRGEALATTGAGRTTPCGACHGADLRGLGDTPRLAGRSPSYLARQLWDLKTGARRGPAVALMQAPVARLSEADIVDLVAYLASRGS